LVYLKTITHSFYLPSSITDFNINVPLNLFCT